MLAGHGRRWGCTATRDNEQDDEERERIHVRVRSVITVVPRYTAMQ